MALTSEPFTFGNVTLLHRDTFPELAGADIVIIGIESEHGNSRNASTSGAANVVRRALYTLAIPRERVRVCDLGNLIPCEDPQKATQQLQEITAHLSAIGKHVLFIGGTQFLTYGIYLGYQHARQVDYVTIDAEFDLRDSDRSLNSSSYNHKIFLHSPNYLRHYTNIGLQGHFVPVSDRRRIKSLNFTTLRLGDLREDIRECEPWIRCAQFMSVDMSAIRASEAPGTTRSCPAGLTTEEICQLMRYAAQSNHLTSVHIAEIAPERDIHGMTALLAAMMIWYFVEGFYNRPLDHPSEDPDNIVMHKIAGRGGKDETRFLKHRQTGRWWFQVDKPDAYRKDATTYIPCTEHDYRKAQADEMTDRVWSMLQK